MHYWSPSGKHRTLNDLHDRILRVLHLPLFVFGATAPRWARASSLTIFLDHTHKEAPQSVGLLWTSDQPVAETSA
jgi:hypothetical protein